jgi:hypothetical protein
LVADRDRELFGLDDRGPEDGRDQCPGRPWWVSAATTLRPPITSLKLATLLLLADGLTMMPLVIAVVVLTDRSSPASLRLGGHPRPTRRSPWVNEYP